MDVYRSVISELKRLPHCADISRKYCSRYCGYLVVDGKYIKVKSYERKIPVIYGIDYLTHDIPTYVLANSENYHACIKFFTSLRLLNYPLQALVSDDNLNFQLACKQIYPSYVFQLCQNHFKQSIRNQLDINHSIDHKYFMIDIEYLFAKKRSENEFNTIAGKLFERYHSHPMFRDILINIQRRRNDLLGYISLRKLPTTNNLIESFNSQIEARLVSMKGFENFNHADLWINGYLINRRFKKFKDCGGKFKRLNGYSSLSITSKQDIVLPKFL